MKPLNNPFVEYGYKGPEYFCDREDETGQLINALYNESNIALISPRRIGKSGLIKHVFNRMEASGKDVACIYIDILNTRNQRDFIDVMATSVVQKLDNNWQSAMRKVSEMFKGLRVTISMDEFTGLPTLSLDVEERKQDSTVERIFEYVRRSGKRCYIAFDEFQQVTEYPERGLEALLRSQIQSIDNAYFIFSGSQQHLMSEMFLSANRPFYMASQLMSLDVIKEDKYLDFANRHFAKQGRTMHADDFAYLYDMVDGQTWYVQTMLHQLYTMTDTELDKDAVSRAFDTILNKMSTALSSIYLALTDNQALLLRAIAKERVVKEPLSQTFMTRHRLPAVSSVRLALGALENKQLVYRQPDGYIVYDRFLGLWLRNKV